MPQLILAPLEKRSDARSVPLAELYLDYFPCVVGRDVGCDVRMSDPMVSRRHCRIDWRNGRPIVEDLDSRNGTEVNGEEIADEHPLAEGDLLQVGGSFFVIYLNPKAPTDS